MKPNERKKIIYVDMDHVLTDYSGGYERFKRDNPDVEFPQSIEGFYLKLEPLDGAIEGWRWLNEQPGFEVFILTAPSFKNAHSYSEKRLWVEKYLGFESVPRLIISAHKGLNRGDYLIDDCTEGKGQDTFKGKLIHFGSRKFPTWTSVIGFFKQAKLQ